jgi:hypothetical protein
MELLDITPDGARLTQGRLEKEMSKAKEKSKKRSEAGRLGAAAKSLKNEETPQANAEPLLKHSPEPEPEVREKGTLHVPKKDGPKADLFGGPEPPVATRKGTRIPDDWRPSEADINFALSEGMTNEEINREADQFRDYWRSRTRDAARANWSLVWKNRIRELADRKRERDARMARSQGAGGGGRGVVGLGEILARRRAEEPY